MSLFRVIFSKLVTELRLQRIGRRSLREVRFQKYKIPPKDSRAVRERLLRRLPRGLETTALFC